MSEVYSRQVAIADFKQQIKDMEEEISDMELEVGRIKQLITWLGETGEGATEVKGLS